MTTTAPAAAVDAGGAALTGSRKPPDLISRAAAGDRHAIDSLLALHEPRIRRLAFRLLGWRTMDLDDVVQDVLVTFLQRLGSFRGDAELTTWLTVVTLNRCRSNRRRDWLKLRWLRSIAPSPVAATASEQTLEREETSVRVRAAVQALRPIDREVVVLYYLEQFPVAEMAKLLRVSPNAIDVRLHRARRRLKEKLTDPEWQ